MEAERVVHPHLKNLEAPGKAVSQESSEISSLNNSFAGKCFFKEAEAIQRFG